MYSALLLIYLIGKIDCARMYGFNIEVTSFLENLILIFLKLILLKLFKKRILIELLKLVMHVTCGSFATHR